MNSRKNVRIEHLIEEGTTAERADKLRHHAAWLLKMSNGTMYGPVSCRCCALESNAAVTNLTVGCMASEAVLRAPHARTVIVVKDAVASTFNIQPPGHLPRLDMFSWRNSIEGAK